MPYPRNRGVGGEVRLRGLEAVTALGMLGQPVPQLLPFPAPEPALFGMRVVIVKAVGCAVRLRRVVVVKSHEGKNIALPSADITSETLSANLAPGEIHDAVARSFQAACFARRGCTQMKPRRMAQRAPRKERSQPCIINVRIGQTAQLAAVDRSDRQPVF